MNFRKIKYKLLILLLVVWYVGAMAQSSTDSTLTQDKTILSYGKKGFIFQDRTGNYLMNLGFRGQFRLAYPTDNDPMTLDDYQSEQVFLKLNRARLKVGGHAYKPWFKYYLEYELFHSNLLDFRLMFEKFPWLKFKIGQWKVQYNRERIISSGKQQTIERSILTGAFTVDRQQGISAFGNIKGKGSINFNYWLSVFMGTGRGNTVNDDNKMMYMSRLQWNPMGRILSFSGSDIEYHEKFTMLLAFAGVTNQSPYTRFSQSGGGQLEGFEEGEPGQYRVNQLMQETAGKIKGFSWQQELHYKQILDQKNNTETEMAGNLIQAGYFFHYLMDFIPKDIEVYGRHAFYFPNIELMEQVQNELSFGINWFLSGHRLKFTAEASHLSTSYSQDELVDGWRYRLQADVSF